MNLKNYYNLSILNNYHFTIKLDALTTSSKIDFLVEDSNILSVDSEGNITPLSSGITEITIKERISNISHSIYVRVLNYIKLNEKEAFIITGTNLEFDEKTKTYSITNGFSGSIKLNFDKKSTLSVCAMNAILYAADIITIGTFL